MDRVEGRVEALAGTMRSLSERVARIEGRLDAVLPAITLAPEPPADQ